MITRRRLEITLGLIWLLDGALQFQSYMFTDAFFKDILGMANMGLPGPVATFDYDLARMLGTHPVAWNAVFASLQVALGLGLLWRRTANLARGVSIAWALGVWVVGEGFGGMFMGGTNVVTGAPGAALLYAVVAILLWPRRPTDARGATDDRWLGPSFARTAWVALWTGAALLELEATNHAASVPGAQLANGGEGEPGVLAGLNHAAGHLVGGQGALFAAVVAAVALAVGWAVLWERTRPIALGLGVAVAVTFGVVGQDIGTIFTGQGTDPGTAPLFVLLALVVWSAKDRRTEGQATREPTGAEDPPIGAGQPAPAGALWVERVHRSEVVLARPLTMSPPLNVEGDELRRVAVLPTSDRSGE